MSKCTGRDVVEAIRWKQGRGGCTVSCTYWVEGAREIRGRVEVMWGMGAVRVNQGAIQKMLDATQLSVEPQW